jgi:hypothetical protein
VREKRDSSCAMPQTETKKPSTSNQNLKGFSPRPPARRPESCIFLTQSIFFFLFLGDVLLVLVLCPLRLPFVMARFDFVHWEVYFFFWRDVALHVAPERRLRRPGRVGKKAVVCMCAGCGVLRSYHR